MPLPLLAGLGALGAKAGAAALPYLGQAAGWLGTAAANPLGQALGTQAIGSGLGWAGNKLFGGGDQQQSTAQPQDNQFNQFRSNYMKQLQNPGENSSFEPIRNQTISDFNQDILPEILSRFGNGGARSSGYQQAGLQAGTDLASRLASMREQFASQRENQRLARLGQQGQFIGGQQNYSLGRAGQRQQGQMYMNNLRQQQRNDAIRNAIMAYQLTPENIENTRHGRQPNVVESGINGVAEGLGVGGQSFNDLAGGVNKLRGGR